MSDERDLYNIRLINNFLTRGRVDSCLNLIFLTTAMDGRIDVENSILFPILNDPPNPGSENYRKPQDSTICEGQRR